MDIARPFRAFICSSCRYLRSKPIVTQPRVALPARRMFSSTVRLSDNENPFVNDKIARDLDALMGPRRQQLAGRNAQSNDRQTPSNILGGRSSSDNFNSLLGSSIHPPAHRLTVFVTKRNTHMTLSAPPPPPTAARNGTAPVSPTYRPLLSYSTGNIGFRKAGRGSYDAAFQLAAFTFKKIQEGALLRDGSQVEVYLRGFSIGREAVCKALLGQEGRLIRGKIVSVTDATRLKIGGSRSPRPRRLG